MPARQATLEIRLPSRLYDKDGYLIDMKIVNEFREMHGYKTVQEWLEAEYVDWENMRCALIGFWNRSVVLEWRMWIHYNAFTDPVYRSFMANVIASCKSDLEILIEHRERMRRVAAIYRYEAAIDDAPPPRRETLCPECQRAVDEDSTWDRVCPPCSMGNELPYRTDN